DEDIIPKPRLEMALHFRKGEIGAAASSYQLFRVVKEVEPEVEESGRNRVPVNEQMFFGKMPPTRPHEQCCSSGIETVRLAFGTDEVDLSPHGIAQIDLSLEHILPRGRVWSPETRHERVRARVERIDD